MFDGVYEVIVSPATDINSNVGSDATNNELEIETGAPVVTITPLVTGDTTPSLSGTINDISATINVTVNGSALCRPRITATAPGRLADDTIAPALFDGVYEVVVTATDINSNVGSPMPRTTNLEIETGAPVVTINPLVTGDTTPELSGAINDISATINVTVSGSTYAATNNGDGTWTLAERHDYASTV